MRVETVTVTIEIVVTRAAIPMRERDVREFTMKRSTISILAFALTFGLVPGVDATHLEWTEMTTPTSEVLNGAFGGVGLTIVVGNAGTLLTSTDGVNWSVQTAA